MHGSILPVTISPPTHTPGDLQLCSHLAVYSPPPGMQKPRPRDSSSTTNTLFCVQNIDYDTDLILYNSKTTRFHKNLDAFLEFLEWRTLHV